MGKKTRLDTLDVWVEELQDELEWNDTTNEKLQKENEELRQKIKELEIDLEEWKMYA